MKNLLTRLNFTLEEMVALVIVVILALAAMFANFSGPFDKTAFVGLVGILIAGVGFFLAIIQLRRMRETEILESIKEIVQELAQRVTDSEEEILFMAAAPAIGASGSTLIHTTNPLLTAWQTKIEDFKQRKVKNQIKIICYESQTLEIFYKSQGVSYRKTLVENLNNIFFNVLNEGQKNGIVLLSHPKTFCEIPLLHILLVDTERREKRAVAWYLSPEQEGKILGVGFSTRNSTIIKTLKEVFNREFKEISGEERDPCRDEKKG